MKVRLLVSFVSIALILPMILTTQHGHGDPPADKPAAPADQAKGAVEVKVDCTKQHQIIRGFGTCLKCWGAPNSDPAAKWRLAPEMPLSGSASCWT